MPPSGSGGLHRSRKQPGIIDEARLDVWLAVVHVTGVRSQNWILRVQTNGSGTSQMGRLLELASASIGNQYHVYMRTSTIDHDEHPVTCHASFTLCAPGGDKLHTVPPAVRKVGYLSASSEPGLSRPWNLLYSFLARTRIDRRPPHASRLTSAPKDRGDPGSPASQGVTELSPRKEDSLP